MLIDIKNISQDKLAFIDLATEIRNKDLIESLQEFRLSGPPLFKGTLTATGAGIYTLKGVLTATVTGQCARCLEPVPRQLEIDVVEEFRPEEAQEEEGYSYTGSELDLEPAIWDNLVLALPARILCAEGCRGLCPVCGQNLNEGDCKCQVRENEAENPFAQLKKLL